MAYSFYSRGEFSSFNGILLSLLALALLDIALDSTLMAMLCISSKVKGAHSLSWKAMSESNLSRNLIKAKSGGGLRFLGMDL